MQLMAFDHQYKNWNQVLGEYVVTQGPQTRVKYRALKKNPAKLEAFLKEASDVTKEDFSNFTREQQISFLVNYYNALVVKLIYPEIYGIDEIDDIGGIFSDPFARNFFTLFGEETELKSIMEQLRTDFNEPRVHFALCNSARSGASLRGEAYVAEQLEAQLEDQARNYINDRNKVAFQSGRPARLFISSVFEEFRTDFAPDEAGLRAFILRYLSLDDDEVRDQIQRKTTFLVYGRQNWSLNRAQE